MLADAPAVLSKPSTRNSFLLPLSTTSTPSDHASPAASGSCRPAKGALTDQDSGAVLAFLVGSLVFGAFAPRKTAGIAAPSLRLLVDTLSR
jgi:hypothetical protein